MLQFNDGIAATGTWVIRIISTSPAGEGPGIGLQIRVDDFDGSVWKDFIVPGQSGTHIIWNDGRQGWPTSVSRSRHCLVTLISLSVLSRAFSTPTTVMSTKLHASRAQKNTKMGRNPLGAPVRAGLARRWGDFSFVLLDVNIFLVKLQPSAERASVSFQVSVLTGLIKYA